MQSCSEALKRPYARCHRRVQAGAGWLARRRNQKVERRKETEERGCLAHPAIGDVVVFRLLSPFCSAPLYGGAAAVPGAGLEPARLSTRAPKALAATNYATRAARRCARAESRPTESRK